VQLLGELPLDAAHPRGGRRRPAHRLVAAPGTAARRRPICDGAAHGRRACAAPRAIAAAPVPEDRRRGIMSIKSDHWIRRMAAEQGMIEPFEPGRCARPTAADRLLRHLELRLRRALRERVQDLHQHQLTIVDPKNFDEKSFVDVKADVCIIPPNSFALARTVEYFRIPRSVLVVCLGKSPMRAAASSST
jgi:hypothetical protein